MSPFNLLNDSLFANLSDQGIDVAPCGRFVSNVNIGLNLIKPARQAACGANFGPALAAFHVARIWLFMV
jgi:hypothetical protein